jgi:hypothetical protein
MKRIRVAAHVHSEWSYDGSWSLERIAGAFGHLGYDGVLMAEHDRGFDEERWAAYRAACTAASRDTILLVPGLEYSDPTNSVHVPVWGDLPFLGEGLETGDLMARVREVAGLAVLAHPRRRDAWRRFETAWLSDLLGVELWNRKYDGYAPSRVGADLLLSQPGLTPIVSLDFHTARQFHPLAMVLDVAGAITADTVYDALRARRAQPTVFGFPAPSPTGGAAWTAFGHLERSRRHLASAARRVTSDRRRASARQ